MASGNVMVPTKPTVGRDYGKGGKRGGGGKKK